MEVAVRVDVREAGQDLSAPGANARLAQLAPARAHQLVQVALLRAHQATF